MILAIPNFDIKNININNLDKLTNKGVRKGFYFAGKSLVRESVKLINKKPKSGRTYIVNQGIGGKILKNKRFHVASAPGEAPAVITGKLRKSITFMVENHNMLRFGATAEYAGVLEKGGIAGKYRIKPRPFLMPSIFNENKNNTLYLRNNILKSIKTH
tara:strand:+ start:770 stop:1243 length:474 start_codon:yes stop_codon:yes gene_type:complete